MTAYAIFTSYARLDTGKQFKKYVEKVRDLVQRKTSRKPVNRICFVDGEGIRLGDVWTAVLEKGVRESEVVVCLISPNYLASAWCGRELEVFLRRLANQTPGPPGPFIFPVWWELLPGRPLPAKLAAFQNNEDAFPARYRERGLRQLATLSKFRDTFLEFVDTLTDRLRDTLQAKGKLPAYKDPIDFSSLPSAFDDPVRAYDLEVLTLHAAGAAWKPADTTPSLEETVGTICGTMRIVGRFRAGGTPAQAIAHARQNRQVLLCVADLNDPAARAPLTELDAAAAPNLAFLLIDTRAQRAAAAPSAAEWAAGFGAGGIQDAARDGRTAIATPQEVPAAIEKLVCVVRTKLIDLDTPARAENAVLVDQARLAGVPTEQRPNLIGPGGGASA
jgi:hypothetical protein